MNLTLLGLGVALVIALPASSSAQRPEKPVVERAPVLKRGNPTAAPKASPAPAATTGTPAKGQVQPAARPTGESDPPEDDTGGAQPRAGRGNPDAAPKAAPAPVTSPQAPTKGQVEPAAARPTGETEPPEDETGGAQP